MTIAGVLWLTIGVLLSIALSFSLRSPAPGVLFVYHLSAAFLSWLYSSNNPADSMDYYSTALSSSLRPEVGTALIAWVTATLREALQASYLDLFMVFHLTGYLGVVILYQLLRVILSSTELSSTQSSTRRNLVWLFALLPGLHVWTSAIGKDAPVFLGVLCFMWGVFSSRGRVPLLLVGLTICGVIRPHIAALLAGSATLALVLSRNVRPVWRITLILALAGGLWGAMPFLLSFVQLESVDAVSVRSYVEERQGMNLEGGSSEEIANYSFPFQWFTFLFRPIFVDASGLLALVASLENLVYLVALVLHAPSIVRLLFAGEHSFFVRFNFVYWAIGSSILGMTTANLGLALRQKMMVVPAMLLLIAAAHAQRVRSHEALDREVVVS